MSARASDNASDSGDDLGGLGAAMADAVLAPCDEPAPPTSSSESQSNPPGSPSARSAAKIVAAFDTAEGVGARVRRSIGTPALWNLSPFLILDHASVGAGAGFPDHPHRGMATVTYVLEGEEARVVRLAPKPQQVSPVLSTPPPAASNASMMQHEDFMGNYGRLSRGDVQWMTAGRGVVHAEMPLGDAVALQLWLDLPAAKKMVKPSYKEKKAEALARASFEGGSVVVVSGESHGAIGPIRPIAGCWFLDYTLEAGGRAWQPIPEGWTAFVYVLEGAVNVGGEREDDGGNGKEGKEGREVAAHHTCVLTAAAGEDGVLLRARPRSGTRFVLIAGEPLDQPMVLQGPFVATSRDGAAQALRDYQSGRNGFEKALGWRSDIGKDVGNVRQKPRRKGEDDGEWEERDPREKGRGRKEKDRGQDEVEPEEAAGRGKGKGRGKRGK